MSRSSWPLFDLRVRTPRLELRPGRDEDLFALIDAIGQGVHDPATMPFLVPWTDTPSPRREHEALQYWWRTRAEWSPAHWTLNLCVVVDDEIVGVQELVADDFVRRRVVSTGSWLCRPAQGRGLGREMRLAALHLAFVGLSADRAETGAWVDNAASLGVTRSLGYEPNGTQIRLQRDQPALEHLFVMDRMGFERVRRDDVVIEHLDACLPLFGLTEPPA